MYEQFRGEVMAKLPYLDDETMKAVVSAIDSVATRYNIERVQNELIVYNGGLPDVCKAYLVSRSIEGLSQKTLQSYGQILGVFFRTMPKHLDKVTTNDLRVWLFNYGNERKVSNRTLDHYRTVVSEFFHWMAAEGWISADPSIQIKPIKYQKPQKKAMGQLDLEYIRDACKTPQEMAIIEVLYSTGCRVTELSRLKITDVDWEHKEVTLFGKGDKYRIAYLNARAVLALRRYLATRTDSNEHLIVSSRMPHNQLGKSGLERIVRRIAERAGSQLGVHITPHVFRHTTATLALQRGMPVQDVQRMLGHTNINTTMVYAEVDQNEVKSMHLKCVV